MDIKARNNLIDFASRMALCDWGGLVMALKDDRLTDRDLREKGAALSSVEAEVGAGKDPHRSEIACSRHKKPLLPDLPLGV